MERHCAGVDEAIENMKKQFNSVQSKLNDMATQNKSEILNYEMAFTNATKSSRFENLFHHMKIFNTKKITDT